jgi:hypothetical protein
MCVHQKENPQKPQTKVKLTKKEMQATLENRRKVVAESQRSALKKKNKVEEGGTSRSRIKKEHEGTKTQA